MKPSAATSWVYREQPESPAQEVYRGIVVSISWLILAVGTLVLCSWIWDLEVGKRVLPGLPTMKFNTALCFIFSGAILLRKLPTGTAYKDRDAFATVLTFCLLAVAGLSLLEYALGVQLGIDNLVVTDTATDPDGWPGRMSVATALCFTLTGLGWLAMLKPGGGAILIHQFTAVLVIVVAGSALLGYVYGIQQLRLSIFSSMALHTSVSFVLNGIAMLLIRFDQCLMSSVTSHYVGGRSFRRLLPFLIVTPVLAGWLSLQGVAAGYYTDAFGFALTSLSSIMVLALVGWLGATALNREEQRFRSTIDSSPVATIMVDEYGTIQMANPLAHTQFRFSDGELLGCSLEQLLPDQFQSGSAGAYMSDAGQRMMGKGHELFGLCRDGTRFRAEVAINPVRATKDQYVVVAVVDITERVEAEQKILRLSRMHRVLSGINTLIVRVQTRETLCQEATRIAVNEGELPRALVARRDSSSGHCTVLCAHAEDSRFDDTPLSGFEQNVMGECLEKRRIVVRNHLGGQGHNDDIAALTSLGIGALGAFPLSAEGEGSGLVLLLYQLDRFSFDQEEMRLLQEVAGDIAFAIDNLEKNKQLEYLTHYDNVTDLPNRLLLGDRLEQAMFQADGQKSPLCILYLDLDRFKQVNDSLGHNGGDEVLRVVAQRLMECVEKADTVSRWGGDEFIVLLPGQGAARASEVANCITGELHSMISLASGEELFISCSIGIAEYPRHGNNVDELVSSARAAMTMIKEHGGNSYRQYVDDADRLPVGGLALETSLRQALGGKQFQVFYQPQVDIATRQVRGLEALVRWFHPTEGLIAPDQFIPLAEKTGLIIPIGEWVLREACIQVASSPQLRVGVNLSARQFHQDNLVTTVRDILAETGIPPCNLELEITESALIYDIESAITTMSRLSDLGVCISLDDFGTGYSSLSYLKRFPIDTLKIDKSFITELTTDRGSQVITNTIIAMAHNLELNVIAEGVETEEQLAMLKDRGCDQVQGYLFSRPLPYSDAVAILQF